MLPMCKAVYMYKIRHGDISQALGIKAQHVIGWVRNLSSCRGHIWSGLLGATHAQTRGPVPKFESTCGLEVSASRAEGESDSSLSFSSSRAGRLCSHMHFHVNHA